MVLTQPTRGHLDPTLIFQVKSSEVFEDQGHRIQTNAAAVWVERVV